MYKIVAQSFPNNEIRVTWSSLPHPKEPNLDDIPSLDQEVEACPPVNSSSGLNESPPLSLVPNSQSERSPAGFGSLPLKPTQFGLNGKRSLIRHGAALEHEAPPEECLFLTGTLPGSTEDSFRSLAEWSGYIVHRLKSWIGNYEKSKYDFYCWEYQRRGALHLHYCVWIRDNECRHRIVDGFHAWWVEILHRIGERASCDMFRKNSGKTHLGDTSVVRAVAEVCRKSPARYLAKYLSKSAAPKRGSARAFSPSRWWGSSRALKGLCDRLTETTEIIVGGFHKVRQVWEDVTRICASSESVTYGYRHKVGSGHTLVNYPTTKDESTWLLEALRSLSSMRTNVLAGSYPAPLQVLKTLKIQQTRLLAQYLDILPSKQQGLRATLESHLNWITVITPSTHQEPLSVLLAWMARTSDIAFNFRFAPNLPFGTKKVWDEMLDIMDTQINILAKEREERQI